MTVWNPRNEFGFLEISDNSEEGDRKEKDILKEYQRNM